MMKKSYLYFVVFAALLVFSCGSGGKKVKLVDSTPVDSALVESVDSDSLGLRAAPTDSPKVGTDNIRMDSMNNNP